MNITKTSNDYFSKKHCRNKMEELAKDSRITNRQIRANCHNSFVFLSPFLSLSLSFGPAIQKPISIRKLQTVVTSQLGAKHG
jgi:hypothetical protein